MCGESLARLGVAATPSDLDLPGYGLQPLKGKLKGFWAIKISGNWRIVFRAPRENKQRVGGLMELLEPGRAGFEERVRSATATVGLAAYLAGAVRRRLMRWVAEGPQLSASGIGAHG